MLRRINKIIEKTPIGKKLLEDSVFRTLLFTALNMGWNLVYGVFNGILGIVYSSGWFYTMFMYYIILGLIKLYVVKIHQTADAKAFCRKAARVTGTGMLLFAVILSLIVMLTISGSVGNAHNIVIMIAIATFTFASVIATVVNTVKAHRKRDMLTIILRNISCASAVGAVLSLERSMLATFGAGSAYFNAVMEGSTGLAAFLLMLFLSVRMFVYSARFKNK